MGARVMGALRGIRVIDLSIIVQGPQAGAMLSDLGADVVLSNFVPGTMESWGLGYEELAAINPRLIYGAASAFGPVGPDAEREGADLVAQAIRLSETPTVAGIVAPDLGQHTEEVLVEAGFSWDEVAQLREEGAW